MRPIKTPYNEKYAAGGPNALTDGARGTMNFSDGNWQGYWGNDIDVVIDLGKVKSIETFSSGFLQSNHSWTFFPQVVEYYYSEDGLSYSKVGEVVNKASRKEKSETIKNFTMSVIPKKHAMLRWKQKMLANVLNGIMKQEMKAGYLLMSLL